MTHLSLPYTFLIFLAVGCQTVFGLKEAVGEYGVNAYAVHQKGVTGAGINIGLLSAGNVRKSHIAFERKSGSAANYDFTESGLSRSSHDTHMAGIILSAGSPTHPDQIGVAPGAHLHSARFSNKQLYPSKVAQALEALVKNYNCRVIMTGIQLPKDIVIADGNSNWSKLYDYYAETYDIIFVGAAGNSSPQLTVFGDIYNGITTTGLVKNDPNSSVYSKTGSASNKGPTADGRKKPEIGAPTQGLVVPTSSGDDHWSTLDANGRGLTSYAIPHTAGVVALLLEAAAKSPAQNDDKTEVIKAVIINSSDPSLSNAGNHIGNPADSTTHWKPDSGYGKLDALSAYQTLTAGQLVQNTPSQQNKGWVYGVMGKNETHKYQIQGVKGQRLVVTVTWHRKLSKVGNKYIEEPNRFYLDLKIISPSEKMLVFETAGQNNLIKTDLFLKENGQYTIILKNATSTENRDYGMAFEILDNGSNDSPPD